jgi:hypothetical protein
MLMSVTTWPRAAFRTEQLEEVLAELGFRALQLNVRSGVADDR